MSFPNSATLYNIIGSANKGLGKLEEGNRGLHQSIFHKTGLCRGLFQRKAMFSKAKVSLTGGYRGVYKKAISLKPDFAKAYNNAGNGLKQQDKLDDAIKGYNKATVAQARLPEAYNNNSLISQRAGV